ncbi:MAG: Flp pilus assembly complex ATPase component, partial [bacterium]|nr:Flp pilus assembly complex ATPase component [bacterium]
MKPDTSKEAIKGQAREIREVAKNDGRYYNYAMKGDKMDYRQDVAFINRERELRELRNFVDKRPSEILFIHGPKSSGKTTLLNVLSNLIPKDERVITVENAAELQLQRENVVTLETGLGSGAAITFQELVATALHMRPDRLVFGECQGGEALSVLQAMHSVIEGT